MENQVKDLSKVFDCRVAESIQINQQELEVCLAAVDK